MVLQGFVIFTAVERITKAPLFGIDATHLFFASPL